MQLKEKTPFCPRKFPFRIKNNKKEIVLVALLLTKKNYVKTKKYSHPATNGLFVYCSVMHS